MIEESKINEIAREVAAANLSAKNIVDVVSEPTTDSEGREALRITIIVKPGTPKRFSGDAVLDTLVQIQSRISKAGDDRFPIIEYATEDELQDSGDT